MAFDARTAATGGGLTALTTSFAAAIPRFFATLRMKGASWLKAVQLARMKSVLMSMNDEQLAQIGIIRTEISRYAKSLISDDQGG